MDTLADTDAEPAAQDEYDVFISHAGDNRAIAVRLRQALIDAGLRPWASFVDIPVGAKYPEKIVHAIERSRLVVLMVSAASMRSEHVYREVVEATSAKKQILPIYIEPEVSVPGGLRYYLGTLHRMKFAPDEIERAGPLVAACVRDQTVWTREATAPSLVERLSVSPLRSIGMAFGVALLAGLLIWGLQATSRQRDETRVTEQRDASPDSLALLQLQSAERTAATPWQLRLNLVLAAREARFKDLKLHLLSRDETATAGELFDLTPVLEPSQVGGGQMLAAELPRLGRRLVVCLTMPHPRTGEPWRLSTEFGGERQVEASGVERISYRQTAAPRSAREDGTPCQ